MVQVLMGLLEQMELLKIPQGIISLVCITRILMVLIIHRLVWIKMGIKSGKNLLVSQAMAEENW